MIRSPLVMAGSSDGGAHLLSFCGADYTTRLLTEWVPDVLTLEAGRGPAHVDARARPRASPTAACSPPGAAADLLVIDRERLAAGDAPRYVRDFPADSGRYVVDAEGYVAVDRQRRGAARRRRVDRRDAGQILRGCTDSAPRQIRGRTIDVELDVPERGHGPRRRRRRTTTPSNKAPDRRETLAATT